MAKLARTKESKNPKEGTKLHPVKIERGRKGPDGVEQKSAYIGSRKVSLGRIKDKADDRDFIATRVGATGRRAIDLPIYKYWSDATWRGDQDGTPQCVAYSAVHRIENSPMTYPEAGPVIAPQVVYNRAQQLDEWPGTNYDGTSVRAGAATMLEKGFISEYQRITTFSEFIDFLRLPVASGGGPILIGIDWTEDMFTPVFKDGRWIIEPTGPVAGGHAILVNGVNTNIKMFRLLNSWGSGWGVNGRVSMRFSDMESLLFDRGGDAWRYVEVRKV